MPDQKQRIKDKISKLVALGNCEGAAETEAETALRQANALMKKHAIQMTELEMFDDIELDGKRCPQDGTGKQYKTRRFWVGQVALGVAEFTDTITTWVKSGNVWHILFEGEAEDTKNAVELHMYLASCVDVASKAFNGNRRDSNDFRVAMTSRLRERMDEIRTSRDDELVDEGYGRSLVFIDQKLSKVEEEYGQQKTRKANIRDPESDSAIRQGREAANSVNIINALTT